MSKPATPAGIKKGDKVKLQLRRAPGVFNDEVSGTVDNVDRRPNEEPPYDVYDVRTDGGRILTVFSDLDKIELISA